MADKKDLMRPCGLVIFTRNTGDIVECADTQCGNASLKLLAMQKLTKSRDAIVFYKDNGEIVWYMEGTEDFPKVTTAEEEYLGNIDDYCPGLLEVFNNS